MTRTNSAAEEKLAIVFFFNDTATTEIYTLSLHDALPILELHQEAGFHPIKVVQHATGNNARILGQEGRLARVRAGYAADLIVRSEEHTSELQSRQYLVCRLLLEKNKQATARRQTNRFFPY